VTLVSSSDETALPQAPKEQIAEAILDRVTTLRAALAP